MNTTRISHNVFNVSRFLNQLFFGADGYAAAVLPLNPSLVKVRYFAKEATVTQSIKPDQTGRVYFEGTWWPACCDRPTTLTEGTVVRVIERRNITLVVEPIPLCLPAAA